LVEQPSGEEARWESERVPGNSVGEEDMQLN